MNILTMKKNKICIICYKPNKKIENNKKLIIIIYQLINRPHQVLILNQKKM